MYTYVSSSSGTFKIGDVMSIASNEEIIDLDKKLTKIQPDVPCKILFTSGTTGHSKAAVTSPFSFVNNGIQIANRTELNRKHHRICVQVPLCHVYGIAATICAAIHHGTTLVLSAPGFNPVQSLRAIVDERLVSFL